MNGTASDGPICATVPYLFGQTWQLDCSGEPCNQDGLCECPAGWTGANVGFDLTGYDCHIPTVAIQVCYTVAAFQWCKLAVVNLQKIAQVPPLKKGHRRNEVKIDGMLEGSTVVRLCLAIHTLPCLVFCLYSIAFPELSVGKNLFLTSLYLSGLLFSGFWLGGHTQFIQFSVLFNCNLMEKTEAQAQIRGFKLATLKAVYFNTFCNACAFAYILAMQNKIFEPDPATYFTYLWLAILFRAIANTTFFAVQFMVLSKLKNEITKKLHFNSQVKHVDGENSTSKIVKALETIEEMWTHGKKLLILFSVLYVVFQLPPCLPFTSFFFAISYIAVPGKCFIP